MLRLTWSRRASSVARRAKPACGFITVWLACWAASLAIMPPAQGADFRKMADIPFAVANGQELRLDLYLPSGVNRPPLIIYIHGGSWRAGSKESMPLASL